jgi:hypothetical protein
MKLFVILIFNLHFIAVFCQSYTESDTIIYPETNLFHGNRIAKVHQNGSVFKGLTSDSLNINPEGIWVMLNQKGDTLWYTQYGFSGFYVSGHLSYLPEYTQIENVCKMDEVHFLPFRSDSSGISDTLREPHLVYCYGMGGMRGVKTMRFIVDSTGHIYNIEQHQGIENFHHCPYYIQSLMLDISSWGPLIPATKGGKKVNVEMIISVDNMNEYMNALANHPAYDYGCRTIYGVGLFETSYADRWED